MRETWLLASSNKVVRMAGPEHLARVHSWFVQCFLLLLLSPFSAQAQFDLQAVERHQLDNGLSLILLAEHTFPSVSVQMLYRVGARDEALGQSGLAHFLEHMAFRASENFPDTEVVSRIYAAGGEWHGYTWIDQTTYYSTVPSQQLDTLLQIEADRMQRLLIEERWIDPEKGAVLAEMHGYENDPASLLHDAVVFQAFLAHPYRANVIGWERDIQALQTAEVRNFYRQHYQPANAVLVVVGDIDTAQVYQRVQQLFGDFPTVSATPLPHTLEPPQLGERRIELLGAGDHSYFEIAYPAPAANDADFAAMLVLQEWLSGGSGVNFMQEFGSTAARPGAELYGRLDGLDTWYPPAAQRYLFSFRGTAAAEQQDAVVEQIIEDAVQKVRAGQVDDAEIQTAKARVLEELVYDLGTHEEVAHELAYYAGLHALDERLALPARVQEVSAADLAALAQRNFQPWQRTIGWYRAGDRPPPAATPVKNVSERQQQTGVVSGPAESRTVESIRPKANIESSPAVSKLPHNQALPAAQAEILEQGLVLLWQENPAASASLISLVLDGNRWHGSSYLQTNHPVWGSSSLSIASLPEQLDEKLTLLLGEIEKLQASSVDTGNSSDPATRLDEMLAEMLGVGAASDTPAAIRAVVLTGRINAEQLDSVRSRVNKRVPPAVTTLPPLNARLQDQRLPWPRPLAQAQLAYAVEAPLPQSPDYLAWRALQYIIAHDYEGRLGKEAVGNRGLAYYIDSQYRSDGQRAWISLSTGVDPVKMRELEQLFRDQISGVLTQPPSETEIAEARSHLSGRLLTARQSNAELAHGLAQQWLWHGRLPDQQDQLAAISKLDSQEVIDATAAFALGAYALIESGKALGNVTD